MRDQPMKANGMVRSVAARAWANTDFFGSPGGVLAPGHRARRDGFEQKRGEARGEDQRYWALSSVPGEPGFAGPVAGHALGLRHFKPGLRGRLRA